MLLADGLKNKLNVCVFREIRGEDNQNRYSDIYSIARLFEAVARRDVDSLATLHQYLHQNMKQLSDSLCECDDQSCNPCVHQLVGVLITAPTCHCRSFLR